MKTLTTIAATILAVLFAVGSAQGNLVLEFNNIVERLPGRQAHISHAMWLPTDYFDQVPGCAKES